MDERPVKAGTVELADGSSVEYEEVGGERVAWVTQVSYGRGGCGHVIRRPSDELLKAFGFRRRRIVMYADAGGRCPDCQATRAAAKAASATAAPEPPKVRQNVPTGLPCPRPGCRGKLLIMTRKSDGNRFMACSAWYGDVKCDYTSNTIPEHVKAKEAGIPMLPLPGLG